MFLNVGEECCVQIKSCQLATSYFSLYRIHLLMKMTLTLRMIVVEMMKSLKKHKLKKTMKTRVGIFVLVNHNTESTYVIQACQYEACYRTRTPPHTPKIRETCD